MKTFPANFVTDLLSNKRPQSQKTTENTETRKQNIYPTKANPEIAPRTTVIQNHMSRCQFMNTIKNSQGSMSPIDSSFPTTSEYSTTADVQEKCIKFDLMTMIKVLKELCKFLKEIEENTSKKNGENE